MSEMTEFILKHGYLVLFGALFAHQLGFPIPGPLFLLAAGALAAAGKLSLFVALSLAVVACVMADWAWYEAGRMRGDKVLHLIHRFAPDPDAADLRAKNTFAQYGPPILVFCKFVPGLDAVAPPLAGTSRTSRLRFLTLETAGAGLYSGAYAGLGNAERQAIIEALKAADGKISGQGGAAERLGLKRTTLQNKMRKLGIERFPADASH